LQVWRAAFLGFWAKLVLFIAVIKAGHTPLVIIASVNSVVSVWYYLRLAGVPILAPAGAAASGVVRTPSAWPRLAAMVFGVGVIVLPFFPNRLMTAVERAGGVEAAKTSQTAAADTPAPQAGR